jgi:DNA-binding transcriptional LysR family regulator
VALVWRRDRRSSPAARAFIDFICRQVGEVTDGRGGAVDPPGMSA